MSAIMIKIDQRQAHICTWSCSVMAMMTDPSPPFVMLVWHSSLSCCLIVLVFVMLRPGDVVVFLLL